MTQVQVQAQAQTTALTKLLYAYMEPLAGKTRPHKDSFWGLYQFPDTGELVAFWGRRNPGKTKLSFKTYESTEAAHKEAMSEAAFKATGLYKKNKDFPGIPYRDVTDRALDKEFFGDLLTEIPKQFALAVAAGEVNRSRAAGAATKAKNLAAKTVAAAQETPVETAPEVPQETAQEVTETPVVAEAQVEQDVPVEPVVEVVEPQVTQEVVTETPVVVDETPVVVEEPKKTKRARKAAAAK